MRSIELRRSAAIRAWLIAGPLVLGSAAQAATHPRYGGTLRVEMRATPVSLDPRTWKAGTLESATDEKMAALVFERLVALDNYGKFQPQLAAEWSHDAAFKRWQFTLRTNVKFSDGTALNAGDVVTALQPLLPNGQQITASGNSVVIQSTTAMPDLLEELASGPFFVFRGQAGGTLIGTGPFVVAETVAASHGAANPATAQGDSGPAPAARNTGDAILLKFRANQDTWSGRPFLDAIEVTLGVPPLRQIFDLQLGKADLIELSPELARRAAQENLRVWASSPVTLYGVRFDEAQPEVSNAMLREALSLTLDRQTMANVLLQKQAEPATALLPQWLSGYAFLFTMETNIDRAKEMRAALPASLTAGNPPLRLSVDAPGDLAKLLGERVAVNARQAALPVQVLNRPPLRSAALRMTTSADPAAGMHLFAWHYSALSPRVELESMAAVLHLDGSSENVVSSNDPEQLYALERKLLEERRVLPLVALPEYVGLALNVRDWMPARWGEWHLADVWLDLPEAGPAEPGARKTAGAPPARRPASPPGAKP